MSIYPRCQGCGHVHGILDAAVSRVRIIRGEGYELNTTMLCERCQDKLCVEMDVLVGITKRIPKHTGPEPSDQGSEKQ